MFSLMDRTVDGISPMLSDLEAHIVDQGLADMIAAAETITSVSLLLWAHGWVTSFYTSVSARGLKCCSMITEAETITSVSPLLWAHGLVTSFLYQRQCQGSEVLQHDHRGRDNHLGKSAALSPLSGHKFLYQRQCQGSEVLQHDHRGIEGDWQEYTGIEGGWREYAGIEGGWQEYASVEGDWREYAGIEGAW